MDLGVIDDHVALVDAAVRLLGQALALAFDEECTAAAFFLVQDL
jgi:hypothetical protein